MFDALNRESSQPLYQQIVEQIKTKVADGRLPAGTRLPTVRQLAKDLGVTRLTVQNAYGELQADGWLEATVGRGTFVSHSVQPQRLLPEVGEQLVPNEILGEIVQLNRVVGVRSMSINEPDAAFFPADEFWGCLTRLKPNGRALLRYGLAQGDPSLRVALVKLLAEQGIHAVPDDLLVTNGATQALHIVTHVLTQPGDAVMIEQPTFIGFLSILRNQRLHPVTVPMDSDGPRLDVLERLVNQYRPRFYYTIPNFHNPAGVCMSAQRRRDLLTLAREYDFIIVEDGVYTDLAYGQAPPPSLKAQDTDGRVFYINSFSKSLMPGLRVGYLLPPLAYLKPTLTLRRTMDLSSPMLIHQALALFLQDGGLKRHIKRVLPIYQKRRDAMLLTLQHHMPRSVSWTRPKGGFCCWLTLPRYFAEGELYRTAMQTGIGLAPAEAFVVEKRENEHFRLSYSNQTEEGIRANVENLATLIREKSKNGIYRERREQWYPIV